MISKDIDFNEDGEWSWHNKIGQIMGDGPAHIEIEKSSSTTTPPSTPTLSLTPSSSTSLDSSSGLSKSTVKIHFVCLFIDYESVKFEITIKSEKWK